MKCAALLARSQAKSNRKLAASLATAVCRPRARWKKMSGKHNVPWAAPRERRRARRTKRPGPELTASEPPLNGKVFMKQRTPRASARRSPEFKGVVKRITGKLTNRPDLEKEGRAEMLGRKASAVKDQRTVRKKRTRLNPDPNRRG